MNLEKLLIESLANVVLMEQLDQWGNKIESPLRIAMRDWANKNHEEIASALIKKFDRDKFADMVANKIVDTISSNGWTIKNFKEEEIRTQVMDIVVRKLAEKQLEKMNLS